MSVITGPEIERRIREGRIEVDPYDPSCVGSNSLDLHLGDELKTYNKPWAEAFNPELLPPLVDEPMCHYTADGPAWLLRPGRLYLGITRERVRCENCTWHLDLRSSAGRLGLGSLAGIGDDGFNGRITVELTVVQPLLLKPGMRLFQLTFWSLLGERRPYKGRYQGSVGIVPSLLCKP